MLKGVLTLVVSYKVGRLRFQTGPEQAWSGMCAEGDEGAPGHGGGVQNPRQVLAMPLHPQPMQVDTDEFRGELPAPHDRNISPRSPDCCRVVVGVDECADCARRHPSPPVS